MLSAFRLPGRCSEITIFNRRDEFFASGQRIVEKLAREVPDCRAEMCDLEDQKRLAEAVRDSDILINATKVGMKPMDKDTLIPAELLHPGLIVADTVYNPLETRPASRGEGGRLPGNWRNRYAALAGRRCIPAVYWKGNASKRGGRALLC